VENSEHEVLETELLAAELERRDGFSVDETDDFREAVIVCSVWLQRCDISDQCVCVYVRERAAAASDSLEF
jgi:hypothetical protein